MEKPDSKQVWNMELLLYRVNETDNKLILKKQVYLSQIHATQKMFQLLEARMNTKKVVDEHNKN
jgi:hypothetical protein